jgi:hypothetical protein
MLQTAVLYAKQATTLCSPIALVCFFHEDLFFPSKKEEFPIFTQKLKKQNPWSFYPYSHLCSLAKGSVRTGGEPSRICTYVMVLETIS